MADVIFNTKYLETILAVNRYIFGDGEAGFASQIAFTLDLNGGTITAVPQYRVSGATTWTAGLAVPRSASVGSASLSTTDNFVMDSSGFQCALNVTAVTGSPRMTWTPVTG